MRLVLGTVQFGYAYGISNKLGQPNPDEISRILSLAKESGLITLDSAIVYGESELRLREVGVNDWRIITKLPNS